MWPFSKKKTPADRALEEMDDAIRFCAEKWVYFRNALPLKAGTPLSKEIAMFAVPAIQGLRNNFREIGKSPDALLYLCIGLGILSSGTHTKSEIEGAMGAPLPDYP